MTALCRLRRPRPLGDRRERVRCVRVGRAKSVIPRFSHPRSPLPIAMPFTPRSGNAVRAERPSTVGFSQRLDIIQLGADRVLAVVDHHVLRNPVIE